MLVVVCFDGYHVGRSLVDVLCALCIGFLDVLCLIVFVLVPVDRLMFKYRVCYLSSSLLSNNPFFLQIKALSNARLLLPLCHFLLF